MVMTPEEQQQAKQQGINYILRLKTEAPDLKLVHFDFDKTLTDGHTIDPNGGFRDFLLETAQGGEVTSAMNPLTPGSYAHANTKIKQLTKNPDGTLTATSLITGQTQTKESPLSAYNAEFIRGMAQAAQDYGIELDIVSMGNAKMIDQLLRVEKLRGCFTNIAGLNGIMDKDGGFESAVRQDGTLDPTLSTKKNGGAEKTDVIRTLNTRKGLSANEVVFVDDKYRQGKPEPNEELKGLCQIPTNPMPNDGKGMFSENNLDFHAQNAEIAASLIEEYSHKAQQVASPVDQKESPYVNQAAIVEALRMAEPVIQPPTSVYATAAETRTTPSLVEPTHVDPNDSLKQQPVYVNNARARMAEEEQAAIEAARRNQVTTGNTRVAPPVPETPRPKQPEKQDPPPVPTSARPNLEPAKPSQAAINAGVEALGAALRTYIKKNGAVFSKPGRSQDQFDAMNNALKELGQQEIAKFNFTEAIQKLTGALSAQGDHKEAIKRAANPVSRSIYRRSEDDRREAAGQLYEHIAASLNSQESSTDNVPLGQDIANSAISQKLKNAANTIAPRRDSIEAPPRLGAMNSNPLHPNSRANSVSSLGEPLPPVPAENSLYDTVEPDVMEEQNPGQDFAQEIESLMEKFTSYKEQNSKLPEVTQEVFAAAQEAQSPHHKLIFLRMFRGLERARRDLEQQKSGDLTYATLAETLPLPEINIEATRRGGEDIDRDVLTPVESLYSTVNKTNKLIVSYSFERGGESIGDQTIDVSRFSEDQRAALLDSMLYENRQNDDLVGVTKALQSVLQTVPRPAVSSETTYAKLDPVVMGWQPNLHRGGSRHKNNPQNPTTTGLGRQNSTTSVASVHAARPTFGITFTPEGLYDGVREVGAEIPLTKVGDMKISTSNWKLVKTDQGYELHREKSGKTIEHTTNLVDSAHEGQVALPSGDLKIKYFNAQENGENSKSAILIDKDKNEIRVAIEKKELTRNQPARGIELRGEPGERANQLTAGTVVGTSRA